MTQDATNQTPLQALQSTLSVKLGVPPPIGNAFVAPGCEQFDDNDTTLRLGQTEIRKDGSADFYNALDHLEAEGAALLKTAETHVEDAGHTILEIGEHTTYPALGTVAPKDLETARALPLALAGDLLHESEHAIVRAFMDAEDVLRHVYLNIHGLWVKA